MRSVVTLTCVCLAIVGCAEDAEVQVAPRAIESQEPRKGGTLVVALGSDIETLNPLQAWGSETQDVLGLMYPALFDASLDCRLSFEGALVEAWSWSEDGATLRLDLREDVSWQDGEPVDAADVARTLELAMDPEVGCPHAPFLHRLQADRPWEVIDDSTLVLRYPEVALPTTMLSHVGRVLIVPQHAFAGVEPADIRGMDFNATPLAAGPFVLDRWVRNQELVLVRRAGDQPHLDRIVFRVIPDYGARVRALESGEVHMVADLEMADIRRLQQARPDVQLMRRGARFLEFIAWNLRDSRFEDVRVRRALAHAIDVGALLTSLLAADGTVYAERAHGTIPPVLCAAADAGIEPIPRDIEQTRKLMAAAGWMDTDGDGLLDMDGEAFRFDLVFSVGKQRRHDAALIVQQQLADLGIDVRLQRLERSTYRELLRKGEFEAALGGLAGSLVVDPTAQWHSGDLGRFNFTGYASPRVDALIADGLAATTPEAADRAWKELQRQVHEDQPFCFLYWVDPVVALDGRVRDARCDAIGLFTGVESWWLAK